MFWSSVGSERTTIEADQPRLPPPQEEVADKPEHQCGPAPPPVDRQTHLSSRMRWKLLKFMRKRQLGENHPYR